MSTTTRLVLFAMLVAVAAAFLMAKAPKATTPKPKGALAVTAKATPAPSGQGSVAAFAMERDKVQSEAISQDQSIAQSQSASPAAKTKAQQDYLFLTQAMADEHEVQSLLAVKGYPSSAVLVTKTGAVVVVGKASLSAQDALLIATTVHKVTGIPVQAVSIVPK